MKHFRERLKDGEIVLGCSVGIAHPLAVELVGYAGFDFVMLDTEHSAIDVSNIEPMLLAARASGVTAIYRMRNDDAATIGRGLDIGVDGILVPHVTSAQQARAVVDAARYSPQGQRGVGPGRPVRFGLGDLREYIAKANERTIVAVMIEDAEAVDNIEDIAAVEGIDVFNIGTGDLSNSLGVPIEIRHPKVLEAIDRIMAAAKTHGIAVGVPPSSPADVAKWAKAGCQFFECCSVQNVLARGLSDIVEASRQ